MAEAEQRKRELDDGEPGDDQQPAAKAPRRNRWGDGPSAAAPAAAANGVPAAAANGVAASLPSLAGSVQAAKELAKEALAKAQRAAEVQKAISAQMGSLVGLPAGTGLQPKQAPQTVRLDAQGRLLDEQGKVMKNSARPHSSMMVNQNNARNALLATEAPPDISQSKYYDPHMRMPGESRDKRKSRAFNFVSEGSWSQRGDDLRAKAAVELMLAEKDKKSKTKMPKHLQAAAAAVSKGDEHATLGMLPLWGGGGGAGAGGADGAAGSSSGGAAGSSAAVARATAVSGATLKQKLAEVPAVEWWDLPLLRGNSYAGAPGNALEANLMLEIVTHYVEHPVPVEPPAEPPAPPPQPLPLTKRERKKLRTQRRLAAEKERQDQIRCGLMPPPPPKVKISNLMQAMKDDAVADPSAMEAKVRRARALPPPQSVVPSRAPHLARAWLRLSRALLPRLLLAPCMA